MVDDGSKEPAAGVVAAVGDERVRALRHQHVRGVAAARNTGLAAARGRWVAFLDDDDEWEPGKLRAQLDLLESSEARWAWCATSFERADGSFVYVEPSPPAAGIGELLLVRNAVPGSSSSVLAEAALVNELGGFDEQLTHLADWDLWIRLAGAAPAGSCPEVMVVQRIHAGGMHATDTHGAFKEFELFRAKHPRVQGREFLLWVAAGHRHGGRKIQAVRDYAWGRLRYRG